MALTGHKCSSGSLRPELLGKPDENAFGAPDVAEPIRVLVLDHFADEFRAAFAEPGERIVEVLARAHEAEVTESVERSVAVILRVYLVEGPTAHSCGSGTAIKWPLPKRGCGLMLFSG